MKNKHLFVLNCFLMVIFCNNLSITNFYGKLLGVVAKVRSIPHIFFKNVLISKLLIFFNYFWKILELLFHALWTYFFFENKTIFRITRNLQIFWKVHNIFFRSKVWQYYKLVFSDLLKVSNLYPWLKIYGYVGYVRIHN